MKNADHPLNIVSHLGDDYGRFEGAVVPPIFQNTLFVQPGAENGVHEHPYSYTRAANPTVELAERKIAALEHAAEARCFSSGMAAISASILCFVNPGSHILTIRNVYSSTRALLDNGLPDWCGVRVSYVDGTNTQAFKDALCPETKLIYLESPSTGVYELQDLACVAAVAQARGIGTVIDNSWATPLHQNPLDFGIDIVVHSATKYLGGHSDVVAGVTAANATLCRKLSGIRTVLGSCMDPHQAFLLTRGLRTLPLRMRAHEESTTAVARFLESHPKVKRVYWPGLDSFPQRELARRQMRGYSAPLSLVLHGGAEEARRFVAGLQVFQHGCSWGGFESLVLGLTIGSDPEAAARLGYPPQLVRLHVGLEHVDTLLADLSQALEQV